MRRKEGSLLFMATSLALHITVLGFCVVLKKKRDLRPDSSIQWVEFSDPPKKNRKKSRQIVEQRSKNEESPLKDYKLSLHNQSVDRQTQAPNVGDFKNGGGRAFFEKIKPTLHNFSLTSSKEQQKGKTERSFEKQARGDSSQDLFIENSEAQTDDYLEDVAVDMQTQLNTREFIHYTYYDRIKKKLKQHWEPLVNPKIMGAFKKGRFLSSFGDKVTHLVIVLNGKGDLVRIHVQKTSGFNELDQAAIKAFHGAAPFPNPPQDIINSRGEVEIYWNFVVETEA